jgi:alginate export protein/uncharacterized protein DUF1302
MRVLAAAAGLLATLLGSLQAAAQLEELKDGIAVGEWTFYPSFELRVRGEYWHDPAQYGGLLFGQAAVQAMSHDSLLPEPGFTPAVDDVFLVSERARLGIRVGWDVLGANLVLQDSRAYGASPGTTTGFGFGTFEPYEAWLDARTSVVDPTLRVRAGRQRVRWGDGRLLGDDDWSARGRSLDALTAHVRAGDVDVEALGALVSLPGSAAAAGPSLAYAPGGTGAQLYGIDGIWRIHPLFGIELTGLARMVRDPVPVQLWRGDTFVADLRLFGEQRGVDYAVEGAFEGGSVAAFADYPEPKPNVLAFAVAGHVAWQTALPGDFRFAARGAYASGHSSDPRDETFGRFDPILPTTHEHQGMMGLYAWSNLIEAGAEVSAKPHEMLTASAGYTFVGLAEPADRWTAADLTPVGEAPDNESIVIGHEIDLGLRVDPWDYVSLGALYGLMVLGEGGNAILLASGRGDLDLLHYGLLQATVHAP